MGVSAAVVLGVAMAHENNTLYKWFAKQVKPASVLHQPVVQWVDVHSRPEAWVLIKHSSGLFNCTAFQPYRVSGYMGLKCTPFP